MSSPPRFSLKIRLWFIFISGNNYKKNSVARNTHKSKVYFKRNKCSYCPIINNREKHFSIAIILLSNKLEYFYVSL